MIVFCFVCPPVCWALVVGKSRTGWGIGAVLALLSGAGLAVEERWVTVELRNTSIVALLLVLVACLLVGIATELWRARRAGAEPLYGRRATGLALSGGCSAVTAVVALLFSMVTALGGVPATVPSGASVLPLPAGLVVVDSRDLGCGSGSQTICTRLIRVRSTTGLSDDELAQRLRDHLTQRQGWQLTQDRQADSWSACRTEGRLLDRRQMCVGVYQGQGAATLDLEMADSD